jgi:2-keto-4-pentenoate hydratase/2-oxohepta-3-ene-1,7-dioic acid hydratase in catechol pathway
MKLASYSLSGVERFGAVSGNEIVDFSELGFRSLRDALDRGVDVWGEQTLSARRVSTREVTWRQPVLDPEKIICVGLNYRTHGSEVGADISDKPSLFVRFRNSLVAHDEPIVRPRNSPMFDYEGELAVVIGRGGRHIPPDRALEHVAGYTCFAENSVRDFQRHSRQATAGKNFERSGSVGPWIVTADEIPDPAKLTLVTRLNGEEVQRASTSDLIFSVPELVAYVSSFTRLEAGDLIATGTPSGVGSARKPPLWMKAGDVLEVEISDIGCLRNIVVDE